MRNRPAVDPTQSAFDGFCQDLRRDIGGHHSKLKARMGLPVFAQYHRQGVRLLAGGAARTPHQDGTSGCLRSPLRQRLLYQVVEMTGLAKEVCLVGRDHVDHGDKFFHPLPAEHVIAIVRIGSHSQGPQPALETYLDHGLLFRTEADAGLGMDQAAKAGKVAARKIVVMNAHV